VNSSRLAALLLVTAGSLAATGCAATANYRMDGGPVRAGETELGHVTGQAEALVILGIVPAEVGLRFERAHADALEQAEGATRLADVEVSDDYLSLFLWSRYVTRVTGIAVQKE
jgi:hypothetical protein